MSKNDTKKDLKILSSEEITKIKRNIKNKNRKKKVAKISINKNQKKPNEEKINQVKNKIIEDNIKQTDKDIIDVCSILEKCSIDEISKYLLLQGKKKSFPDITTR